MPSDLIDILGTDDIDESEDLMEDLADMNEVVESKDATDTVNINE